LKLQKGESVDVMMTSKALNAAWNVQPGNPTPNVNAHGCCVNHWYRVPATLCPKSKNDIKAPDGDFGNKPSGGRFSRPFRNFDQPSEAAERVVQETKECVALQLCTCGAGCKPGSGCLAPRFENSASRHFEKTRHIENK